MVIKTNRIPSTSEMIRRRFHADVRGLKKKCKSLDIVLYDFYSADNTMLCVLSSDEYEIGEEKCRCLPEHENYFVSEEDYLILMA